MLVPAAACVVPPLAAQDVALVAVLALLVLVVAVVAEPAPVTFLAHDCIRVLPPTALLLAFDVRVLANRKP